MQVDLFSNSHLRKQINRRISYIRNTKYTISSNISKDSILNYCLEFTNYDKEFAKAIQYSLENPRNCFNILGTEVDTHFNLESLNISSRSRDFIVVYSIQHLLPLILNIACDVNPMIFKEDRTIKELSRAILEIDFDKSCKLSSIIGLDDKLDKYLNKYLVGASDEVTALSSVVHELNSIAMEVLKYIVGYLESYSPMVVLCLDKSKVLLSSNIENVEKIELVFNGYKFTLNPFITNETFGYYKYGSTYNYLEDYCEVQMTGGEVV